MGVAHVLNGEDEASLILVNAFPDLSEKALIVFTARFLFGFCQRNDLGSLAFWHCSCLLLVLVVRVLVGGLMQSSYGSWFSVAELFFSRSNFLCGVMHFACLGSSQGNILSLLNLNTPPKLLHNETRYGQEHIKSSYTPSKNASLYGLRAKFLLRSHKLESGQFLCNFDSYSSRFTPTNTKFLNSSMLTLEQLCSTFLPLEV